MALILTPFGASPAVAAEVEAAGDGPEQIQSDQLSPVWAVGDKADADVVASIAFTSVDPDETARRQAQAAAETPVILRLITAVAGEVVTEFDRSVVESREKFQEAVVAEFGPLPLDAKAFLGDEFNDACRRWIAARPEMLPPWSALARAWATQSDDTALLQPWRERLHAMLAEQLVGEPETAALAPEASPAYRVVSLPTREESLSRETVAQRASLVDRSHLLSLPRARALFLERWDAAGPGADFVAGFLRANTMVERALTESDRAERASHAFAPAREHPAGTMIVRKGETITPGIFAALTDLRAHLAEIPAPAVEPAESVPAPVAPAVIPVAPAPVAEPRAPLMNWIFLIGVPVSLGGVALAVAWLASRLPKRSAAIVPTTAGPTASPDSPVVVALRDTAVQRLYSDRQSLLADQDRSADQVQAIEARVARLQPQIQEKIRAYEGRIKELEALLATAQGSAGRGFEREITRLRRERADHLRTDSAPADR